MMEDSWVRAVVVLIVAFLLLKGVYSCGEMSGWQKGWQERREFEEKFERERERRERMHK